VWRGRGKPPPPPAGQAGVLHCDTVSLHGNGQQSYIERTISPLYGEGVTVCANTVEEPAPPPQRMRNGGTLSLIAWLLLQGGGLGGGGGEGWSSTPAPKAAAPPTHGQHVGAQWGRREPEPEPELRGAAGAHGGGAPPPWDPYRNSQHGGSRAQPQANGASHTASRHDARNNGLVVSVPTAPGDHPGAVAAPSVSPTGGIGAPRAHAPHGWDTPTPSERTVSNGEATPHLLRDSLRVPVSEERRKFGFASTVGGGVPMHYHAVARCVLSVWWP
jgi:hypothetical protein